MTVSAYEIGGLRVDMTQSQANRWNEGETTPADLDTASVSIPTPGNHSRYVSLRRATNAKLEPIAAAQMRNQTAILIREQTESAS